MIERDYIAKLEPVLRDGQRTTDEALLLANEAVQDFPNSSGLWFLRGQLIWRAEDDYEFFDREFVASMLKVIELDPTHADAYEALGSYHDGLMDDPDCAMAFYRRAANLRGKTLE